MFEGFLARAEIVRVGAWAGFEPGDVSGGGDGGFCRVGGAGGAGEGAVEAEAAAHGFAVVWGAGAGGGRHAHDVGEVAELVWVAGLGGIYIMMAMAATFAVVAFTRLAGRGAEGGEGFVVLEVGLVVHVRSWGAGGGGVSAAAAGSGVGTTVVVAWAGGDEGWKEAVLLWIHVREVLVVGITSGRLQSGKAIIVLELEVRRRIRAIAVGNAELLHQSRRIVGEEAGVPRDAVPS